MVRNKIAAFVFRLTAFVIGAATLITFSSLGGGFMDNMLVFFTIHTNIFTTVLFGILTVMAGVSLIKNGKDGDVPNLPASFQLAFTFYITITCIVYWTMLSGMGLGGEGGVTAAVCNVFLHLIIPLLAITDSLIFLQHGRISKKFALVWLIYPLLYLIFIVIRANVGGPLYEVNGVLMHYPYPFVDPVFLKTYLGSEYYMIPIVIALCAAFWAFGLLYIFVDKKINTAILKKYHASPYLRESV